MIVRILIIIMVFWSGAIAAQDYDTVTIPVEDWESENANQQESDHANRLLEPTKRILPSDYSDSQRVKPEYDYLQNLDSLLRNYKEEEKPPPVSGGSFFSFLNNGFLKVLLWGLAIFAVLYVLYHLIAGQGNLFFKNKKLETLDGNREGDTIIASPLQLLQQAAARGDYRQAVRYQYAYLLQLLGEKQHVIVQPQKTSQHYMREVSKRDYASEFARLTLQYEYVWFGGVVPNNVQYETIHEGYRNFLSKWL
jgi:hypothetical protein